jgi:hypothetical protein
MGCWVWDGVQTSYFDTYPGFAVVGGIALIVYIFVAAAMFQCDQHQRFEKAPMPISWKMTFLPFAKSLSKDIVP